jgi:hypothetical protein
VSVSATASTFVVEGTLTLDEPVTNDAPCFGADGYDDITEGAQVIVTDATGRTVGIGELLEGEGTEEGCEFQFEVDDVPSGAGPYSVEVTHRGKIAFQESDAQSLDLTLGD